MRVEAGHPNWYKVAQVFLDGTVQLGVVLADEEYGYIDKFKLDDQGQHITEANQLVTERKYGKVHIILRPE